MKIVDHRIDELHCDNRVIDTAFELTVCFVILLWFGCLCRHSEGAIVFYEKYLFSANEQTQESTACSIVLAPGLCLSPHVRWGQPGVNLFFIVSFKNESKSIHFSIGKILDLEIFWKKVVADHKSSHFSMNNSFINFLFKKWLDILKCILHWKVTGLMIRHNFFSKYF